jgi:hypothetical protein
VSRRRLSHPWAAPGVIDLVIRRRWTSGDASASSRFATSTGYFGTPTCCNRAGPGGRRRLLEKLLSKLLFRDCEDWVGETSSPIQPRLPLLTENSHAEWQSDEPLLDIYGARRSGALTAPCQTRANPFTSASPVRFNTAKIGSYGRWSAGIENTPVASEERRGRVSTSARFGYRIWTQRLPIPRRTRVAMGRQRRSDARGLELAHVQRDQRIGRNQRCVEHRRRRRHRVRGDATVAVGDVEPIDADRDA